MLTPKYPDNSAFLATNFQKAMHPGSIIDNRYQIIQQLGLSEIETTYLAKDLQGTTGGSKCVVEQLSFEGQNNANWNAIKQYLRREAMVLERLGDHPQIPQLYNYFSEDKQFYLIREYIDGDSLEQEVERQQFNEANAIYLIQDSLRILDFIHKTNVVHRNIRPAYLLKRKQDNAYVLTNFGAFREIKAAKIDSQGKLVLQYSRKNLAYSAPEQKNGKSSFSSDIYALGRTAIYALTGKSPQELEQSDLDWRSQCQISDRLEAILNKMMSPILDNRYHSALEVLQDLRPLFKINQLVGGRYCITNYLGGNEGVETYLADNLRRQYQSPCLIKQIELPQQDGDDKMRLERRFAEELSILERLGYHEQIPQLWDHFEENDEFYLVQQYIRGENLAQRIEKQQLTVTQITQILDSTLIVLQFVHQNRIIHRNIKPSNLIVRELDCQVILTDFGILQEIKAMNNAYSQSFNKQNYWSPEQIAGRPNISSDLYALGMTVIEALTGHKPATFVREETGKLLWQENLNLDRRFVRIIDRLVELDLSQRYQSAERVLNDLRKINGYTNQNRKSIKPLKDSIQRQQKFLTPLLIGLLGIICLLGSIEFAFPIVRPFYYRKKGEKLLPQEPQSALRIFNQAIDLKPQSWRSWLGRGDALALMQRNDEALEAYDEAAELNPSSADNWKKRGDVLSSQENFAEAIAAYNEALTRDSENAEIYHLKAEALFQLRQYDIALTMQDEALKRNELNTSFLSGRGKSLFQLGRFNEALRVFNRVQAIDPDSISLWQDKFLVLEALNRPQEAERLRREISNIYERKIQQQPQEESILIASGDFFTDARMFSQAVETYERAIELEPNNYLTWLSYGKALTELNKFEQAEAAFNSALQIRPQSYRAKQGLGRVYQAQNNFDQAIANYDQALEINSQDPTIWRDRGIVFKQQRRYSKAIESLTKASELTNYDSQTWQQLAKTRAAMRQVRLAISAIEQGLKYYPQDSELWSLKALIQTQNGQYNEACNTYRGARAANAESEMTMSLMRQLGCRMN